MNKKTKTRLSIGISCFTSAGGSGVVATELGIALAKRGHNVHFVTEQMPFRLREHHERIYCHIVETANYPVLKETPYYLALASRIAEVVEENGIQIWHAHYAIPHAITALTARSMLPAKSQFCLITTLHGTDITIVGSEPSLFRITKFAMEQSCAITAVSDWLKEQTIKTFNLSKPIHRIYNFIEPERFQRKRKIKLPWNEKNKPILMHISNFRAVKRVTDVVRIFAKVREKMDALLVMIGEGPERISSVGVARQLNVIDSVRYLGNYPNIEELLPYADLVLQPSEHESFGMVPLEAMASGVPVIATKSGGIQEVVVHGETGYLCEVGDIEFMAHLAIEILKNPQLKKALSQNAIQRVKQHFSDEIIIPQYENLYYQIIQQSKRGKKDEKKTE